MLPAANSIMTWINLSAIALVLGYAVWMVCQTWKLFASLLRANTADEVLRNILVRRRFYLAQGLGCLVALTALLGVKALFLLFKLSVSNVFSLIVFGDLRIGFLIGKLGCLGVVLTGICLACFYQYLKSRHYLEVLYALRDKLGLPEPG